MQESTQYNVIVMYVFIDVLRSIVHMNIQYYQNSLKN